MVDIYIFEVIAYIISCENIDDSDLLHYRLRFNKDGSIDIYNKFLGMFFSKDLAEQRIKDYIQRDKGKYDYDNIYLGFAITRHQLNAPFSESFDDIQQFSARYTYDSKGDLLCDSEVPYDGRTFKGRKNLVKFNVGDIAIVKSYGYDSSSAHPVQIVDLPLTEAQWKKKMAPSTRGDYTDDCYIVVQKKFGHYHPESVEVFPFLGEVPKKIQTALTKEKERYMKGEL